uniref:Uncharacterized protein n=1 Tax=Arundo donax TaxID=35708 RepID=A0A0A9D655_ARUDO
MPANWTPLGGVRYASHRVRRESTRRYALTRQKIFGRACLRNTDDYCLYSYSYIGTLPFSSLLYSHTGWLKE